MGAEVHTRGVGLWMGRGTGKTTLEAYNFVAKVSQPVGHFALGCHPRVIR